MYDVYWIVILTPAGSLRWIIVWFPFLWWNVCIIHALQWEVMVACRKTRIMRKERWYFQIGAPLWRHHIKNPLRFNDPVCGNQCSLVEWCPHKVPWLWGVIFLCQTKQAIAHQLGSRRGDLIGQVGVMSSQPCDHFTYPTGIMWTIWKRTDTLLQLISMVIRLNDIKIITRK